MAAFIKFDDFRGQMLLIGGFSNIVKYDIVNIRVIIYVSANF